MSAGFYHRWDEQPGFGIPIAVSLFLHIIILAVIFLFANSTSSKIFTAPVYTVDLVAPEKPAAPSPKIYPPEEQVKPIPADAPQKIAPKPVLQEKAVVLKPVPESFNRGKEKKPSLDDAIKKIQERVKKREAEEAVSKAVQKLEDKQLEKSIKEIKEKVGKRQLAVRPMKTQPDTIGLAQTGGTIKRIEELEGKYYELIRREVEDKWIYSEDIRSDEVVIMSVRIDKSGRFIESHIERSSGNPRLVQSVVRAVEKASSSFPPLPPELGKDFVEIGICFPECEK